MPTPRDLLDHAVDAYDAGDLDAALAAAVQAATAMEGTEPVVAGRARRLAADCLAELDRHPEALGLLKSARRAFVADDPAGPDVAGTEVAAARSLRAIGKRDDAKKALQRAEASFSALDMPVRAAVCVLDRGVIHHDEGDIARAVALLGEARQTFLAHRRPDLAAIGDFDLGVAQLDDGRPDDAIERFLGARGIFSSLGRIADEAACDLNMGVALEAVGRRDEARQALRRARDAFRGLGRERDVEQAEHDLDVLDGLVDPDTAELSVLRSLGPASHEVEGLAAQLAQLQAADATAGAEVAAAVEADDDGDGQPTGGMTTDSA